MSRAYLGIDPGATGALALYSRDTAEAWDFDRATMLATLMEILAEHRVQLAVVEHVSAMPGQGVTSMFSFGQNFGWWLGTLEALGVPVLLVRPQAWQKSLGVPKKAAKADKPSLDVARRLFPSVDLHRKKDHGRADALLLAFYANTKGEA